MSAAEHTFVIKSSTNDTILAEEIAAMPRTTNIRFSLYIGVEDLPQYPATCLQIFKYHYDHKYSADNYGGFNRYWDGFIIEVSEYRASRFDLLLFAQRYCEKNDILAHVFASAESFQNILAPLRWHVVQTFFEQYVKPLCKGVDSEHIILPQNKHEALDYIATLQHCNIEQIIVCYCAANNLPNVIASSAEPYGVIYVRKIKQIFLPRIDELLEFVAAKLQPVQDLQFVEFMLETV